MLSLFDFCFFRLTGLPTSAVCVQFSDLTSKQTVSMSQKNCSHSMTCFTPSSSDDIKDVI